MTVWLRRSGALQGAAASLTLFLIAFALAKPASLAGVDLEAVRSIAEQNFTGHLVAFGLRLLLFVLAFGAVAGLWSAWVAGTGIGFFFAYTVLLASLNARAMAMYPQLFSEHFYLKGGLWESVQTTITTLPHPLLALLPVGLLTLKGLRDHPPRLPAKYFALLAVPMLAQPQAAIAPGKQPNILILAADSLRPDFLTPQRAPMIHSLKSLGTSWPHTFVHSPRTFPSWSEILSGNFSPRTGIRHMFPAPEERRFGDHSLVNRFNEAGYQTFVVGDYAADIFPRFDAGFGQVVAPIFDFPTLLEEQILRSQPWLFGVLAWRPMRNVFPVLREFADLADPAWLTDDLARLIPSGNSKAPFFGVAFYSVAHFPYAVPWPYYTAETDYRYQGKYKFGKPPLVGEGELSKADIKQVNALFAGGVRAFDHEVGRILEILRLRRLEKDTIVVIMADHGENLYERPSDTGHGEHLIGLESLRIPFIVYDPTERLAGGLRPVLAQSVDIVPTLLELAGLEAPADIDGFSLAATTSAGRDTVFAESGIWFADTNQKMLAARRIPYPDILALGNVDYARGNQIVLKSEARPLVLTAKHQMAFDGKLKVLYTPTLDGVKWEMVNHEADLLEKVLLPIPAPGAWDTRTKQENSGVFLLQQKLLDHARQGGATVTSEGWILPGDGTWAP